MEQEVEEGAKLSKTWRRILLVLNCIVLSIGNCGGRLITRLYFVQGGKRIWFSGWLETSGWPVILIPLIISYFFRRNNSGRNTKFILMERRVFLGTAVIGILTGLDNYLYAYGVAWLPVSTSVLIAATHLGFTALFAFLVVKQRFTAYSINAIVLLTVGSGILAMNASGDRPKGESTKLYVLGFVMTLAASALYGLILPLVELMYMKGKQAITYTLVLEIQLLMCIFATAFCTVGMIGNGDFQAIPREAKNYNLGEIKYYVVIVWSAIFWQCFFLGAIGVIFCSSSFFSGVIMAVLLPATEILAVIFFREKFQAAKGVSLVLSIWGFVSYFYGEIKQSKKAKIKSDHKQNHQDEQREINPTVVP